MSCSNLNTELAGIKQQERGIKLSKINILFHLEFSNLLGLRKVEKKFNYWQWCLLIKLILCSIQYRNIIFSFMSWSLQKLYLKSKALWLKSLNIVTCTLAVRETIVSSTERMTWVDEINLWTWSQLQAGIWLKHHLSLQSKPAYLLQWGVFTQYKLCLYSLGF